MVYFKNFRKLAKSTLILLPLFSIYYIAFSVWQPFVTNKLSVEMELIRLYFEIVCSSFQVRLELRKKCSIYLFVIYLLKGMLISLIFCFFNSEVKSEIRKLIERKILEYDPQSTRRFSRFISNKDKINSIPSIATQDRLRKISSKEISPKSLYNGALLAKNANKSRESSVFFPKRKSKHSSTPTEFTNLNNLSVNRLNLINNSADNTPDRKNTRFLNFFKRSSNESDPYEDNRFKIKFKKKNASLKKVDSFKIIKNYMHKEIKQQQQNDEDNSNKENGELSNMDEIINVERDSLDSLDIIDTNYPSVFDERRNVSA